MQKKCVSNFLITGESNFDEKSVPTAQSFIPREVTSYKIHTVVESQVQTPKIS